eukprot:TRINITY_DN5095_c0_g1_i3.p1 TRINITY_DN5095_c0_g1~~TRINITY_DN5095_c0_g1_i3.p1  ORF type:complete len:404 (+),score=71.32 TRINITY_DN5095_c0_g1_i3:254-1465(+)
MTTTMNRPKDTMNLLSHDMTPVEPSASLATGNPVYEPSTGQPKRAFNKTNHIAIGMDGSLGMMTEPVRTGLSDHVKDPPSGRLAKPKAQIEVAKQAKEFYQGKHSTPQTRANAAGISLMFDNTDVAQKRQRDQKQREKEYSDANWQSIQDKRKAAMQARREQAPEPMHDPWSGKDVHLIHANDRVPRKAVASNGKMYVQASPTKEQAYVDYAFGKDGSGAPRHRPDGALQASVEGIFEKNIPFTEGPADSYVAIHLGKTKPPRTNSGTINARRKQPRSDNKFDPYFDKFMGKPQAARTDSGRINAHRSKTVSSFDTSGKNTNDFFGPRFGTKPKPHGRVDLDSQWSKEATVQPETFLDRMKTIEAQVGPRQHMSVERDDEFAVCVERAQRAKTMPARAPPNAS